MMAGVLGNLHRGNYAAALVQALTKFIDQEARFYKGHTAEHYAYLVALAVTSGKHLNTVIEGGRANLSSLPSKSSVFRRLEHITNQRARDLTQPTTLAIAVDYARIKGFSEVELCLDETDLPSSANRRRKGQNRKLTQVGQLTKFSKHGHKLKPNGRGPNLHAFLDKILFGVEYLVLVARFPDGAKFPLWTVFVDPIRHPTVERLTRECQAAIQHFQGCGIKTTFIGDRRWDSQDSWLFLGRVIENGSWVVPLRTRGGKYPFKGGKSTAARQSARNERGNRTVLDCIEQEWLNAVKLPGAHGKWISTTTSHIRVHSAKEQHLVIQYWTQPTNIRLGNVVELWKDVKAQAFVVGHHCDIDEGARMLEVYRHRWDGSEEGIRLLKSVEPHAAGPRMGVRLVMLNSACVATCIVTWITRATGNQQHASHAIAGISKQLYLRREAPLRQV